MKGRVNKREAGDLRRHRAHYDVTVMKYRVFTVPVHTGSVGLKLQDTFKSGYSKFVLKITQSQVTEWRRKCAQTTTAILSWHVQNSVVTDLLEYQSKEMDLVNFQVRMLLLMVASSNGNIFRVTGHLCGEFTGHR